MPKNKRVINKRPGTTEVTCLYCGKKDTRPVLERVLAGQIHWLCPECEAKKYNAFVDLCQTVFKKEK